MVPKHCANLSPCNGFHHPELIRSSLICVQRWLDVLSCNNRCENCWLKKELCFCSKIPKDLFLSQEKMLIDVLFYYHYQELGRSSNTAHIFKYAFPYNTQELLFGDFEHEMAFFDQVKKESLDGSVSTCILYPSSQAIPLSQWKVDHPTEKKRIIVLDGTYAHAKSQYKHLSRCIMELGLDLPVVKLDLGPEGCLSSTAIVMGQPGKDKMCSFQAAVMGLEELGVEKSRCQQGQNFLDQWISYILEKKIKLGKQPKQADSTISA